jgi:hypothetical protein
MKFSVTVVRHIIRDYFCGKLLETIRVARDPFSAEKRLGSGRRRSPDEALRENGICPIAGF